MTAVAIEVVIDVIFDKYPIAKVIQRRALGTLKHRTRQTEGVRSNLVGSVSNDGKAAIISQSEVRGPIHSSVHYRIRWRSAGPPRGR